MNKKKYLFPIALLISLLIILIPVALAAEIDAYDKTNTYDNLVIKKSEQKTNLYQSPGDRDYLDDPGRACVAQHEETSSFADTLDNSVISTLEKIATVLFTICIVTSAIDTVVNTISLALGMISGDFCCPAAVTPPGAAACVAATTSWRSWSIMNEFFKTLCCFVNCGWCTGGNCGGILSQISLGAINNVGLFGPGEGLGQVGISPYDNIYTAVGCLCPVAVIFNLRKLKTIYDVYDCCIEEACENGLSTESCERQLDEATCMYWEGSLYSMIAKLLISLIAAKILGPIIEKLAEHKTMDMVFSCAFAVFKLIAIPKVIDGVMMAWEYMGRSFGEPNCEDLDFDDVKEEIEQDWDYLTLVDRDGDGIYDNPAKNYVKVSYNELPNNIQSLAKEDTEARLYKVEEFEGEGTDKKTVVKEYYEFTDKNDKKRLDKYDSGTQTSSEVKGLLEKQKIKGKALDVTASFQTFGDGSILKDDKIYTSLTIELDGSIKGKDSAGYVQDLGMSLSNPSDRAAILAALDIDTTDLGEYDSADANTLKFKEGSITLSTTEDSQTSIVVQGDKTTTTTRYNDGTTLTQLPDEKWEYKIKGKTIPITSETDLTKARVALSQIDSKATNVNIGSTKKVTYKIGNKDFTIDTSTLNQVTKTESWTHTAPGISEKRTITTTTKDGTTTVDLTRGTTTIATGLDPTLIGGVENIDWSASDSKFIVFKNVEIPILGITLDKNVVVPQGDGSFKLYSDYDAEKREPKESTIKAQIFTDAATGTTTVTHIDGQTDGKDKITGQTITTTETIQEKTVEVVKQTENIETDATKVATYELKQDVKVTIDGQVIDINKDLFSVGKPFEGLEGSNLLQAAEAYDALNRPVEFKISLNGDYSNGKNSGEEGYGKISYTIDQRNELTFTKDGNYGSSMIDIRTGRVKNFQLGNTDTQTQTSFHRQTTKDGKEVFKYGESTKEGFQTKEKNGYEIVFVNGELTAIDAKSGAEYSLERITDSTLNDVRGLLEDPEIKAALANKDKAKKYIKQDQQAKEAAEKEKAAAEKAKTAAEKRAAYNERWNDLSLQSYALAWELLDMTLGESINDMVKDKCKEDSGKSYPPSDTPTDSGTEEPTAECEGDNIYNAQFIEKTELTNTCEYKVSYSIKSCKEDTISYTIALAGPSDEEVIESGELSQGQAISRNRIIESALCTHQSVCIKGDGFNQCYPPLP